MSLGFASPHKIVFFHQDKIHVQKDTMYTGKICGSSKNRKVVPMDKWVLKKEVYSEPTIYRDSYREVLRETPQLKIDGIEIVKKTKKHYTKVWELQESEYFRLNKGTDISQIGLYGKEFANMFEKQEIIKVKQKPYHERNVKVLSRRTKSKIENKIGQWTDTLLNINGNNPDKLNFQFFTFTVTTPQFDHERTVKAWKNFMSNYKDFLKAQKKSFNYLWVAEKQDGSRAEKVAAKCLELIKQGVNVEYNKKRYVEFKEKAQNPTNNIHYHLLVDRYHNVQILNHKWLVALENQGAARFNSDGVEYRPVQLSKRDKSANPSTLSKYLSKYMSKSDAGLKCQLWHCTNKISETATSVNICNVIDVEALKLHIDEAKQRVLTLC